MIRARRAWNLFRARAHGGAVILLYHRVARPDHDPFGLCVSPEHFAEHMKVVAGLARPVALSSLSPGKGPAPRSVAVTFDDAYEDVLTDALPVLERFHIPATVFAVSGILGESYWWDRMARIPLAAAGGFLEAGAPRRKGRSTGRSPAPRKVMGRLHAHLLAMAPGARDRALVQLLEGSSIELPLPRSLAPGELRELAASGTVEIGGHTQSHPNLAALKEIDQEAEISRSREVLQEVMGTPITSFAYPYGTLAHFTRATVRMVERCGFERACTAEPGVVGGRSDPFGLPRLWVGDWEPDEFRRRLAAWLR